MAACMMTFKQQPRSTPASSQNWPTHRATVCQPVFSWSESLQEKSNLESDLKAAARSIRILFAPDSVLRQAKACLQAEAQATDLRGMEAESRAGCLEQTLQGVLVASGKVKFVKRDSLVLTSLGVVLAGMPTRQHAPPEPLPGVASGHVGGGMGTP